MPNGNKNDFELLKKEIVFTMQQPFPGLNPVMAEWKSQEITDFQEELRKKVNAHISEKWFYDHFKKENPALPRIDLLNLLSRYAGYLNWDDFLYRTRSNAVQQKKQNHGNLYFIYLPVLVLVILGLLVFTYRILSFREYRFSFFDALTNEPVSEKNINIILLSEKESPLNFMADSTGKVILHTEKRVVKLIVNAPYFKQDTITRILKTFEKEQKILLRSDDFARMILYFSEMNIEGWQKRRAALDSIIDDRAMIYQTGTGSRQLGVELFNKQEFIDKITMPALNLKRMEVLETRLTGGKIVILRFRIREEKE